MCTAVVPRHTAMRSGQGQRKHKAGGGHSRGRHGVPSGGNLPAPFPYVRLPRRAMNEGAHLLHLGISSLSRIFELRVDFFGPEGYIEIKNYLK